MFFVLSKALSLVLEPLAHPFLLLIVSPARQMAAAAAFGKAPALRLLLACRSLHGFLPFSQAGLMLLENRFPIPTLDERPVDGVIVLGGHTGSGLVSQQRGQPQQNQSAERLTMACACIGNTPMFRWSFQAFQASCFTGAGVRRISSSNYCLI